MISPYTGFVPALGASKALVLNAFLHFSKWGKLA